MSETTVEVLRLLCNKGIETIVSRRYDEAIETLTAALQTFQEEQHALSKADLSQNDSMEGEAEGEVSPSIPVLRYYRGETDLKEPIFTAPLVVPASNNTDRPCSAEQFQFLITYNLALSYHLCAMATQDVKKLEVALGLWDLIYRFHWNESLGLVTFHTCAILNNYGHGLRQVGAEKPAQECFESLLCALCVCVQNKGEASDVDACRIECFYRNITPLVLKNPQTAGAA
ncbi:MAG: hypothetical protein SGILL_010290 [Bacillariaceae sp.]